jgi:ribosomal protein L11 methyltransferase
MYLWRKFAGRQWFRKNERALRSRAGDQLTIIERPNGKRLQIEVTRKARSDAQELVKVFGGRIEKLPRDWLKRFRRHEKREPLKIGKRLLITNVGGTSVSRVRAGRAVSRRKGPSHIVIPAGAAFGTGEHATTAICLRLLERVMKSGRDGSPSRPSNLWDPATAGEKRPYYLVVDLGTGSGILALAARLLGAERVIGIDNDPLAIATARQNARLNKIDNVQFRMADVRRWKLPPKIDIVTANLFSDLLVEILPKLKQVPRLILSGIMRDQELALARALKRNKIDIVQVRRRGKWVAMLVKN